MSKLCTLAFLVLSLLAGCASSPPKDPLYSGEYFYNFESSYLTPDGKDEAWCIDAGRMERAMLPARDVNGQWGTSHVVVRGKLGPRGSYGGLGRCRHVLEVTEIIEISNMRGRDG
ncbi:MAG: hypothetical protein J0L89_05705 [Xanthomonadales bacterium]|nr:hypothetical protein [Xanthomonadales bacterium]